MMQDSEGNSLNVSFGYTCNSYQNSSEANPNYEFKPSSEIQIQDSNFTYRSNSFSCLSGAALSANATLANTNMCNGLIGEEILPGLDSPKSFRRMTSSPSFSRLDLLSSSHSSICTLGSSISNDYDMLDTSGNLWKSLSAPTRTESSSFLNAMDVQMAGGAAGEDRVQAVCSEENGWLFCGVYDGFNGRDAADFLAGTLYETIGLYLNMLQWPSKESEICDLFEKGSPEYSTKNGAINSGLSLAMSTLDIGEKQNMFPTSLDVELSSESFRLGVLDCLSRALAQAESDFMYMVEQAMEDRPDLVSVGSCVLTVLLHGRDLYVLNLGDSRAVLATYIENGSLIAVELTETHSVDNEVEYKKLLSDHPDDPNLVIGGKVKGKLKLTRAFGVGYLKKSKLNDALMGILRVSNLCSPPYIYTHPFTMDHRVSENDLFVVLGSDGLFDFFQNEEVVHLVHLFIMNNPFGDPAKHLIELLVLRAAESAGFSTEELMRVPAGRRRKYHDDVTIIVIILGNRQRTSTASTSL